MGIAKDKGKTLSDPIWNPQDNQESPEVLRILPHIDILSIPAERRIHGMSVHSKPHESSGLHQGEYVGTGGVSLDTQRPGRMMPPFWRYVQTRASAGIRQRQPGPRFRVEPQVT